MLASLVRLWSHSQNGFQWVEHPVHVRCYLPPFSFLMAKSCVTVAGSDALVSAARDSLPATPTQQ